MQLLTVVPSFRSLRSSVTPEGTATFDNTIVAHDFCDLLAEDAPFEPEKVQVVARSSNFGPCVIEGAEGTTKACTQAEAAKAPKRSEALVIIEMGFNKCLAELFDRRCLVNRLFHFPRENKGDRTRLYRDQPLYLSCTSSSQAVERQQAVITIGTPGPLFCRFFRAQSFIYATQF